MTELHPDKLEDVVGFSQAVQALIESDPYIQRAVMLHEHSPAISFANLHRTVFPPAFFQLIQGVDESHQTPTLWFGNENGYGLMQTIDWHTWKILERQLTRDMKDVGNHLLYLYLSP